MQCADPPSRPDRSRGRRRRGARRRRRRRVFTSTWGSALAPAAGRRRGTYTSTGQQLGGRGRLPAGSQAPPGKGGICRRTYAARVGCEGRSGVRGCTRALLIGCRRRQSFLKASVTRTNLPPSLVGPNLAAAGLVAAGPAPDQVLRSAPSLEGHWKPMPEISLGLL